MTPPDVAQVARRPTSPTCCRSPWSGASGVGHSRKDDREIRILQSYIWRFPKIRGSISVVPFNNGQSILGSILEPRLYGSPHLGLRAQQEGERGESPEKTSVESLMFMGAQKYYSANMRGPRVRMPKTWMSRDLGSWRFSRTIPIETLRSDCFEFQARGCLCWCPLAGLYHAFELVLGSLLTIDLSEASSFKGLCIPMQLVLVLQFVMVCLLPAKTFVRRSRMLGEVSWVCCSDMCRSDSPRLEGAPWAGHPHWPGLKAQAAAPEA